MKTYLIQVIPVPYSYRVRASSKERAAELVENRFLEEDLIISKIVFKKSLPEILHAEVRDIEE